MRLFYNLLSISLSVTPLIILLLCINPILQKRYSAKWRYILWIAVSIRMLLPFSYGNYLPELFKKPVTSGLLPSTAVSEQLSKIEPVNLLRLNDSLGEVLYLIYCIVVILYLVYIVFSYIGFLRDILRWSKFTSNNVIKTILTEEKKELNIRKNVQVFISKKVKSPMLVGLIKPILVLPSENYTPDELRMILKHELVHFKRNDIIIKAILMVVSAVHWFNPAVHFMVKQANKDMEQSCDDYVLNDTDVEGKRFYCNIILKMAVMNDNAIGPVFSTNIITTRKSLELRIKGIFDNSKKRRGIIMLVTVILLVINSGTLINVSGVEQPEKIPTQNSILNEQMAGTNEIDIKNENKAEAQTPDANNQPQNIESESGLVEQPVINNISQAESSLEIYPTTQENINNDIAEVIIVDLNQLEKQLQENETTNISE
ncbi:MAG TPA: hypothetical protein DCS12_08145 [Clostridiales bacterium]|nr:hypothetical protein [Clostridiales bacterium]